MVLTNIELWAADGSSASSMPLDFESNNPHTRHLNPFDPRAVSQINPNLNHLSSNGYYGFSYVNAAHDAAIINNNNNNNQINYNNSTTYNLMANVENGINNTITTTTDTAQQTHASSVNFGSSACSVGHAASVPRCKKRFFVMNDDDDVSDGTATKNKIYYSNNCEVSAKRCRFDDDFSAQYCNDFFQLPSTQIATQSCLMDTEEGLQQQVDVAMFENNNNNIEKYEQKLNPQLQNLSAHNHQQHSQQELQSQQQQLQHESQQQHLYHQQQHYQDIQISTIKCHFNHNSNCDTLNNRTCKIDLEKNTKIILGIHNTNLSSSIQNDHDKYDNDVANDFRVDDATLFAQLHGGCLHHHDHHFNTTVSSNGVYIAKKDAINNHLQDDNYCEEF